MIRRSILFGIVVVYVALMALLAWSKLSYGAEVPYTFQQADAPLTDDHGRVAIPEDIDEDGTIVANADIGINRQAIYVGNPLNARQTKFRLTIMESFAGCTNPFVIAISRGIYTGDCDEGAFVRYPNGSTVMLSALGLGAMGLSVSTDGYVCGRFFSNGRLRGFCWHPSVGYQIVTYIDPRPGVNTSSMVFARNASGKKLGVYSVDDGVHVLENGYYLEDNGQFTPQLFPINLSIPDMNDLDQMVVFNPSDGTLMLYDDGNLYSIPKPASWLKIENTGGMNNSGQFVGMYQIQVGTKIERHAFVASPAGFVPDRRSVKADRK